jgi:hypothetical protein
MWNAGLGFVHFLMNRDAPHRTKAIWISSQRRVFLWKCKQEIQMAFPDPDQLKITGIHQPTVNTVDHSSVKQTLGSLNTNNKPLCFVKFS